MYRKYIILYNIKCYSAREQTNLLTPGWFSIICIMTVIPLYLSDSFQVEILLICNCKILAFSVLELMHENHFEALHDE